MKSKKLIYFLIIFYIGLISSYDNTLTLIYGSSIRSTEKNPAGLYLIELGDGHTDLFIVTKAISTILVIILCFVLVYTRYRLCILAVFLFQIILLYNLTFHPGGLNRDHWDYNVGKKSSPVWGVLNFYTSEPTEDQRGDYTPDDKFNY
jgi:hypothetical protein